MAAREGNVPAAAFLLGAYSLTAQVVLFRELFALFAGNEIVLGMLLSSWLLWVSVGSGLLGKAAGRSTHVRLPLWLLGAGFVLAGTVCFLRILSSRIVPITGELTGYWTILLTTLLFVAPAALIGGFLFSLSSKAVPSTKAHIAGGTIYTWESWGSALAGLSLGLFLFPRLGTLLSAFLYCAAALLLLSVQLTSRRLTVLFAIPVLLALFVVLIPAQRALDGALEAYRFPGYRLVGFADTPYGRVDAVRRDKEHVLFENSRAAAVSPDLAALEEKIHFPLLTHAFPRRVLLLGRRLGDLDIILTQYDLDLIRAVEMDEMRVRLGSEVGLLKDIPGMELVIDDTRGFVARDTSSYDVVIMDVGDPVTLQLNRFYSVEFFRLMKRRLSDRGIFAFTLPGAENLFIEEQEDFLGSIYLTLKEVFPTVLFLPGTICHFMALGDSTSLDARARIVEGLQRRNLNVSYIAPSTLRFRFSPLRMIAAKRVIHPDKRIQLNKDFAFTGYLYDLIQWNRRIGAGWTEPLRSLVGKGRSILLIALLAVLLVNISFLVSPWGEGRNKLAALGVFTAGFSAMSGSIAALLVFQIICGVLYQWLALFSGAFMAGAGMGSMGALDRSRGARGRDPGKGSAKGEGSIISQWMVHLLFALLFAAGTVFVSVVSGGRSFARWEAGCAGSLFQFALGWLSGQAYVGYCRLRAGGWETASLLYAVDIAGGLAGASLFALLLLPFCGVAGALIFLVGANLLSALSSIAPVGAGTSQRSSPRSLSPNTSAEKT